MRTSLSIIGCVVAGLYVSASLAQDAGELSAADILAKAGRNVVMLVDLDKTGARAALGNGILLQRDYAITRCTMVRGVKHLGVKQGEQRSEARLIRENRKRDMCEVIIANSSAFSPISINIRWLENVQVGETVYVLGAPQNDGIELVKTQLASVRGVGEDRTVAISAKLNAGYNGGGLFDRFGALIGMAVLRKGKGEAADYVYPVQSFLETKNAKVPATQTPRALTGNADRKPEAIAADATATARVTATIPAPTAAKGGTPALRSTNDASSAVRDPAVAAPGKLNTSDKSTPDNATVVSNAAPATDAAVDVRSPRIQNSDYRRAVKDYLEVIVRASTHQVVYPEEARHARWTGTSSIVFRVKSGGEVSESYVDRSSGYAALDVTALLAVRKAIAETPPPAIVKERGMTATVAIAFVLPEK